MRNLRLQLFAGQRERQLMSAADAGRRGANDHSGSIAGRHERPLMGTSGLSRCPIKAAVRRQTAHSLKPSFNRLRWPTADTQALNN